MSDEVIGLDDDSVSELEQAKKGKPRMFVMLCKGVKILKMFVFRKGQPSTYVQQAKKEGFKGAVYSGVVKGQGQDLTFELAKAEGYDSPPGKELVLKDFLKAHGVKCDPTYAIVDALTVVREEDAAQPESETPKPVQPTNSQAPTSPPPSTPTTPPPASTAPPPPSPLAAEFANRLKALKPNLDRALASQVPLAAQVAQLAATAGAQARKGDFTTALQSLGQLETLVAEALKQLAATPSEDPAAEFNERLKKLLPSIKEAANTAIADSVKLLSSEAGALARGKKFAEAHQKLDELEKLLQRSGDGDAGKTGKPSNEFPKLWAEAKSTWQNAIDTVNGQLEKLAAALREANDEELKDIAEFGLNAVTNNHRVRLQAAMMDVDDAKAEALASKAARASNLVLDFRDHLEVDERVQACDENPFDVTVTIRAELVPALTMLEEALSQATTA